MAESFWVDGVGPLDMATAQRLINAENAKRAEGIVLESRRPASARDLEGLPIMDEAGRMTPAERALLRAVAHALLLRLEGRADTGVSELQAALAAVDVESPPPAPAPWTPSQGGIRSWPPR